MRILWVCNLVLPGLCDEFGFRKPVFGGWLSGMWNSLKENDEVVLGICLPIHKKEKMHDGEADGCLYYSFWDTNSENDIENQIEQFESIFYKFNPDVIHIWGTEYIHSYCAFEAAKKVGMSESVVIALQGILQQCINKYYYAMDDDLKRLLRIQENDSESEYNRFKIRSLYEDILIKEAKYFIGRTDWDRSYVKNINNNAKYYYVPPILRSEFYNNMRRWNCKNCDPYRIFISQASYPIKGLHLILDDLGRLKKKYPELTIGISGTSIDKIDNEYCKYLLESIEKNGLEECVDLLGEISADEMIDQYIRARVFLSCSLIENESNSILEAMTIGTPVVSSYVGGISSVLTHKTDGFLYPLGEEFIAAEYISEIFDSDYLANNLSEKAIYKSTKFVNQNENIKHLIFAYKELIDE